ncbi:MAG: outer membrane lipoprotein carrier protein LolA [Isosphaerales bacterium]
MTIPPPSSPDDSLARAEAALRRAPVPEGPSDETVARTLAALRAKAGPDITLFPRRRTMLTAIKIAAAVLAAAGGLFYFAFVPSAEATIKFAEVAQKLRDAHTLAYRTTTESPDLKAPMKMRLLFKEPSLFRTEVDGGIVTIVDGSQGKQLMLDPAAKTALLLEGKAPKAPSGPAAAVGLMENLRQLTEGDAKLVGDKLIGDVRVRGFLVKKFGMEMTIWVDPGTRLPVRIESSNRIQGKEIRVTLTDFQIDPKVDEALFRIEPPTGYSLQRAESTMLEMDEKAFLNPEKAAVAMLRNFAEKTGGTFPKRLDDLTEVDQVFRMKLKLGVLPDAETIRVAQSLIRFVMATQPLKGGFGYRSDGVKLGDAEKILFWYRPEGAANYRVIHGDLHVADVTADRLPEKPKP